MNKTTCVAILLGSFAASFAAFAADDETKGKGIKYVPPTGFAGRSWGELRNTFDRLPQEPLEVGAAYILRQENKQGVDFRCHSPPVPLGPRMNGPWQSCDFSKTFMRMQRDYQGGGFYVLSEYSIPDQGFRMGDEKHGVVIHPVIYQFCANWHGSIKKKEEPKNFEDINKFCGMRLLFQSETREELTKLPEDHVTVYDRMRDLLLAKYGRPAHFSQRGQVIIQTEEEEFSDPSQRKFSIYRWCPAAILAFHNECKASVVMTINPTTGVGTVLYSTPLLWEYAFARENNGFKGDHLFNLLHAWRPK
jgi:hypothetical protein